jgi:hypothetical protein
MHGHFFLCIREHSLQNMNFKVVVVVVVVVVAVIIVVLSRTAL